MRRTPLVVALFPPSGAGAFTTSCIEIDGAIGDRNAEGGAYGTLHQADLAAMRSDQLRGNCKAQSGSTRMRSLKSLEQVCAGLFSHAGPGV